MKFIQKIPKKPIRFLIDSPTKMIPSPLERRKLVPLIGKETACGRTAFHGDALLWLAHLLPSSAT